MIGCQLNHLFIIFGTQIHEIIIDRIHYLPFHVHFIMQMRTGTFSCTTHFSDNLTTYHFLAQLRPEIAQVCIHRLITEAVVYAASELLNWFKFTRRRPKTPDASVKAVDDIEDAQIIE